MAKRRKGEGYVNPVLESPDAPVARLVGDDLDMEPDRSDTQEEVHDALVRLLDEAIDHYESELEPDQAEATNYYYGRPFGDEKEGRSKVVNTVVRDATLSQIPSLMRIVYEAENVAEFKPRHPEDEPGAKQATEYVRYIVTEDNPGFSIFWSWIMDALVRRVGIVKWWWEVNHRKTRTEWTGLTEQEVQTLAADPELEIETGEVRSLPDGSLAYDVSAFREQEEGIAKIECVPNEEFVWTPGARSLEDATLFAHVRELPSADVLAMLVSDGMSQDEAEELIAEHKGKKRSHSSDELDSARQFNEGDASFQRGETDDVEDVVLYCEAYALIPVADEGYESDKPRPTERRLFKCVGPEFVITNGDGLGECTDDINFAVWTPIPEPHTIVGLSNHDLLKDPQRIISQLERGMLDSLAQAITPVTEVVNGMVNMQDFINPEVSGIRRVRAIGQTQTIVHHFVGGDVLPVLGYYGQVIEDRTGKNKGAMGLDADALQSTTKVAAAAILSASQQRIEIIARVFAETGLKPLFKGLLKLVTKHQNRARLIRLRNEYVEVDPRTWDATMDVKVNVALGAGTPADKVEVYAGIATKQQELIAQGSPLATNVELRHTLGKMAEMVGEKDSQQFFRKWGEQEEQQMREQMAQQPPPPDPNMALVQVEQMKAQADMMLQQEKFKLEQWKAIQEDDRARDKQAKDAVLKERELELKFQAEINDNELKAQVARERAELDADVKREAVTAMGQPRKVQIERSA